MLRITPKLQADGKQLRELGWWQDHYDSRLRDLAEKPEGRQLPTEGELNYICEKIASLERAIGPVGLAQRSLDRYDRLIIEWVEGEKRLIEEVYGPSTPAGSKTSRPQRPGLTNALTVTGHVILILSVISALYGGLLMCTIYTALAMCCYAAAKR